MSKSLASEQCKSDKYPRALLLAFILMMLPQVLHGLSGVKTVLFAVFYLISILVVFFSLKQHKIAFSRNRAYLLFIYILVLIMPIFYNIVAGNSIATNDYFDTVIRLVSFVMFFLMIPKNIKLSDLKVFFYGVVVVIVIACLYNLMTNFGDLLNIAKITNSYSANFMSFFANRNTFAMYLFAGIFSTLVLLKTGSGYRKLLIFVLILEIINLIFTMSRGGILATLIVLLPTLITYFRRHKVFCIISMLALFGVIGFVMSNSASQETITRLFIRPDAGTSGRSDLWQTGVDFIKNKNIITGVGYYTAIDYTGIKQFHSMFVDTLVDTGILGLLFKISIFMYIYLKIYSNKFRKDLKTVYKWGIYAILFLSVFESVNIFALGSTEMLYTILFINIPLVISESNDRGKHSYNEGLV